MNSIHIQLTPKEIHILIQALRIAGEDGSIEGYCKQSEYDRLMTKLNNVKD